MFLVGLALGARVSQVCALTRLPAWLTFALGDVSVTLTPSPSFLAKYETGRHPLAPFTIPAWLEGGRHHLLYPVAALRSYLRMTGALPRPHLFCRPGSSTACTRRFLDDAVRLLINEADPGLRASFQDFRRLGYTLHSLRHCSLPRTLLAGGWVTASSFRTRSLSQSVTDTPCVAMGALPSS